jgi:hypothetical protein
MPARSGSPAYDWINDSANPKHIEVHWNLIS